MPEPLLQLRGINKRFGALQVNRDLSFAVTPGEIHALIGPNGAGKTTALDQLTGELRPDSGVIYFNGRDITQMPVHARARLGLARSFQITALFEQLTTEQNLALAVQAHQGHSFHFWRRADLDPQLIEPTRDALKLAGLEARAGTPAANLSHGERRQLEVGMALAGRPRMLLLDEPMAGLGPGGTTKLSKLIDNLKGSLAILLVEHDMEAVFSLADRISVLVSGEAIATGTPEQIRNDPAVRKAYLGKA